MVLSTQLNEAAFEGFDLTLGDCIIAFGGSIFGSTGA
jgi:hypothetical protein